MAGYAHPADGQLVEDADVVGSIIVEAAIVGQGRS